MGKRSNKRIYQELLADRSKVMAHSENGLLRISVLSGSFLDLYVHKQLWDTLCFVGSRVCYPALRASIIFKHILSIYQYDRGGGSTSGPENNLDIQKIAKSIDE